MRRLFDRAVNALIRRRIVTPNLPAFGAREALAGRRARELWAVVAVDEHGNETMAMAFYPEQGWMHLVFHERDVALKWAEGARRPGSAFAGEGCTIELRHFEMTRVEEVIR